MQLNPLSILLLVCPVFQAMTWNTPSSDVLRRRSMEEKAVVQERISSVPSPSRELLYLNSILVHLDNKNMNTYLPLATESKTVLQLALADSKLRYLFPEILQELLKRDDNLKSIELILQSPHFISWGSVKDGIYIFDLESFKSFCVSVFSIKPFYQTGPPEPAHFVFLKPEKYVYKESETLGYHSGIILSKFIRLNLHNIINVANENVKLSILRTWFRWMLFHGYHSWIREFLENQALFKILDKTTLNFALHVSARNGFYDVVKLLLSLDTAPALYADALYQSSFADSAETFSMLLLSKNLRSLSNNLVGRIYFWTIRLADPEKVQILLASELFFVKIPPEYHSVTFQTAIKSQRAWRVRMILESRAWAHISPSDLSEGLSDARYCHSIPERIEMMKVFFTLPDVLHLLSSYDIDNALFTAARNGFWELMDMILWNENIRNHFRAATLGYIFSSLTRLNDSRRMKKMLEDAFIMDNISGYFRGNSFVAACHSPRKTILKQFSESPGFLDRVAPSYLETGFSYLLYEKNVLFVGLILENENLRRKLSDRYIRNGKQLIHLSNQNKLLNHDQRIRTSSGFTEKLNLIFRNYF